MNVSITALPLYCERRTSSPRESRSTKSAAGAGGFNSPGAWSFAVAPAAPVARVEVVFDEPPQAVSSAAVALVAMMNARSRGARFLFFRAALRYGDSRASNRVPAACARVTASGRHAREQRTSTRAGDARMSTATVVSVDAVETNRCTVGADIAAPSLASLLNRESSDPESDHGVKPPPAEDRVGQQPDQHARRQIRAQHVLGALPGRRRGSEPGSQPRLRPAEKRHQHDAPQRQSDSHPARARALGVDQGEQRLRSDIGSEQKEAAAHQLLGATLSGVR